MVSRPRIRPTWEEKALLDLVTIKNGQVDPKDPAYRDLPLIAPDHLSSRTGRLLKKVSAADQGAISGKYLVRPGDVIYSKIRPYLQKAYRCDFDALCSADMYPFTPRSGVDASFVVHLLLGQDFTNFATSVSARSGIPKINRVELSEYRTLVPTGPEQRAIGSALTDADGLVENLERLVAKKEAVKQGMMQELLTGRTRLRGFTDKWTTRGLGAISDVNMGQSPAGSSYNTARRGMPLVQGNADIRDRRTFERVWTTQPTKRCVAGDVLLTVRAPVGFTAIASVDSCLGRGVCALTTSDSNRFLYHALVYAEPKWQVYEQGSTFTAVNSNEVRLFEVPWPSSRAERSVISNILDDADREIAGLRKRLAKATHIKNGMMQDLLSGRARLADLESAV